MLIPGSLSWLKSKLTSILSRGSQGVSKWILAPLAACFGPSQRLRRCQRSLASLVLYDRFLVARSLNEADAASAVMSALIDHCEHYPNVELDDVICRDLQWILCTKHDVSILCGHVRVLIVDKNSKHADKAIKMLKRIVMV